MVEVLVVASAITVISAVSVFAWKGFGIVRPSERGVVERLGKFNRVTSAGLALLIPFVDELVKVNVTEQICNAQQQEVITKDSLNAVVDAQVYYKVRSDEESVFKSQYAVNNYAYQIVQLARTTLRDLIGNKNLTEVNSQRSVLNQALAKELSSQTEAWGIEVVRCELKEIQPPKDVQDVMNEVVVAEKKKVAAVDFATAAETEADGRRRAAIKSAEGEKRARVLRAEGESEAIKTVANADAQKIEVIATAEAQKVKVVSEAAEKYFKVNAQKLKQLEVAEVCLSSNLKIIVPEGSDLVNVIGESTGVVIKPRAKGEVK